MVKLTIEDMVERGVHLGHSTTRWNPKMAPYIYTKKNGIYIIDLIQTASQLRQVCRKLEEFSSQKKTFLFVGTKRQVSQTFLKVALECDSFYVNQKWLGGMLTNWQTIKKSLATLKRLERQENEKQLEQLTKKEITQFRKRKLRLEKYLGGLKGMNQLPDVVIIVGQIEEMNAVLECQKLGVTTVSVLDTDCDPTLSDLFVVANDDSVKSLSLICDAFLKAILTGRQLSNKQVPNSFVRK